MTRRRLHFRSTSRQRGLTLLEISVAVALSSLATVSIVGVVIGQARQARFDRAVTQASAVAQYADDQGRRVTATALDPATEHYTYTYGFRSAAFKNATVLQPEYNQIPTVSEYGTPFFYQTQGGLARAKFEVPATDASFAKSQSQYEINVLGTGNVEVIVPSTRHMAATGSKFMLSVKTQAYQETTR